MRVFTIGFTKKPAELFFSTISQACVKRLLDVRLNNVSQLAGFSKKEDLRFFLKVICGIEYVHLPEFAPTKSMLDEYRKQGRDWKRYEEKFISLMSDRHVENAISKELIDDGCLLCSEAKPNRCHRRLVAEYLKEKWGDLEIRHL